ncbi:MAG: fibronectin type III domain-containing protein [Bacteroidales bacterium]|jgi:hypothetical protein|nr:fibronectin type III domain-containing protein [Bacteroidales bacterium]
MKKLFFLLVMAIMFAMQVFSQTSLNEGFEGALFPPDEWTAVNVSGSVSWARYTSSSPMGTACASVNYANPGHENWLITPKLSIESATDSISFYLKTAYWFGSTEVNVRISTTDKEISSFNETALLTLGDESEEITSTWTRHAIDLSSYNGGDVYIAFQVVDNYGSRIMLDDVQGPNLFVPSCPKPTMLAAHNPTTSSIDLSWVYSLENASLWNIQYMLADSTSWENALSEVATSYPYNITELAYNTSYKVRIQTYCGDEQSDWTNPITFKTACNAISVPWEENFDSSTNISPCSYLIKGSPSISTSQKHSNTSSLRLSNGTYITTPSFAEDISQLRVKFWAKSEGSTSCGTLEVGIMSDPTDSTTFESIYTIAPSTSTWGEYEVMFNTSTLTGVDNYIAFKQNNNTSWYWWIDDIVVDYLPSCIKPTNIVANNITTNSAEISFTSNALSWNLEYILATDTSWINAMQESVTTNSYTITGLTDNTSYKVRMQTDCGDQLSEWTSPITFTTPCAVLNVPTPIETFNVVPPSACWSKASGALQQSGTPTSLTLSSGNWTSNTAEIYPGAGNNARINVYGNNRNGWLISPSINLGEDGTLYQVEMDVLLTAYSSSGLGGEPDSDVTDDVFGIVISTDNGLTWDAANAILWTNQQGAQRVYNNLYPMQHISIPLENANGNPYQGIVKIGIYAASTISDDADNDLRIDNFIVKDVPLCATPTDLAANNITTTSADISFTSDAYSWNIEYMLVTETSWENAIAVNATANNPYSITNLLPSSTYKVRVQAICGSEEGEWSLPLQFSTTCAPISVPYTQNFDASMTFPACCSLIQGTPSIVATQSHSASNSLQLSYGALVATPQFAENINLLRVKFWVKAESSFSSGTLQVGIMSDPTDATTFESLYTIQPNSASTWIEHEVMFNASTLTGGNRYIAFKQNNNANWYWWIDDIVVDYLPPCLTTDLTAINLTATSADISFTSNDASLWDIEYMLATETSWENASQVVASTNPYTITQLTASTSYKVRVKAVCGEQASEWTSPITFKTPCASVELPYVMDFENQAVGTGNVVTCWTKPFVSNYPYVYPVSEYAHSGSNSLFSFVDYSNSSTIITPSFTADINSLRIKLWAMGVEAIESIAIGVMSDLGSVSTIEMVDTIALTTTYAEYEVAFNETTLMGTDRYIVIKSFTSNASTSGYTLIDDVEVSLIPECAKPTDLTLNNITPTTAELSWISDGSLWNIEYMLEDSTSWENAIAVNATASPYTITLLTENTSYLVRMQTICDEYESEWTSPIVLTTLSIEEYACPRPENVVATNITTTSADISWNETGANSYIVSYLGALDEVQTNISATASPLTLTGLISGTDYTAVITAICGEDTSSMSDIIFFTTSCQEQAVNSFPWEEGFENGITCWGQEFVVGAVNWSMNHSDYTALSGNFASFNILSTNNSITKLVSPVLDITTLAAPMLEFYHIQAAWVGDQDTLRVYYRTSSTSNWIELLSFESSITSWRKDSISLPNPSSTYQLAFEAINDYGHGIGLDNIKVYEADGLVCIAPTGLQVDATTTTATLSWSAGADETAWQVKLTQAGSEIDVQTLSYQFSELTPNTTYNVYVRAVCGSSYSTWQSIEFTTLDLIPTITTNAATMVTQFSATLNGEYSGVASAPESKGFEYKLTSAEEWNVVSNVEGETSFYVNVTSLEANTAYVYKAFIVVSGIGTIYGEEVSFTTLQIVPPTVVTEDVTEITETSATFIGEVTQGTEEISARGFELKVSTLSWDESIQLSAQGTSPFTLTYNSLEENETYNVRAYVKTGENGQTTTYGEVQTFTTLGAQEPIITLGEVTATANVLQNSVELLGEVLSLGGAEATNVEVGFRYTLDIESSDFEQVNAQLLENNSFSSILTNLLPATTYYYIAFITNDAGTAFSEVGEFTTNNSLTDNLEKDNVNIIMYPNPAEKETKLFISGINNRVKMSLTDVQGRIIFTQTIIVNDKAEQVLNLSNLARGVYYIFLQGENINRTQKLIVK